MVGDKDWNVARYGPNVMDKSHLSFYFIVFSVLLRLENSVLTKDGFSGEIRNWKVETKYGRAT